MINIFFIHRFPFTKEAYNRDEFEFLMSQGFNVKFLDIANFLKRTRFEKNDPPALRDSILSFPSKTSFAEFLIKNKRNSIIVTDVGLLTKTSWMYLAIAKSNIPYVLFENTTLPSLGVNSGFSHQKVKLVKFIRRLNLKKFVQKPLDLVQYNMAKYLAKPAEMIITSKQRLNTEKAVLLGKNTALKYTMTLDYKVAMNAPSRCEFKEPYAVFIDQYFIHHPDFKTNYILHYFTANQYYSQLNIFLKAYSAKTGLKVLIAAHPRRQAQQRSDFDPDFELHFNRTAELIRHSETVLLHFSTAINFAVIFNKPFLLLDSPLFDKSNIRSEIEMISSYFDKSPLNMSAPDELTMMQKDHANLAKYKEYQDSYIKHPEADEDTLGMNILQVIETLGLSKTEQG